MDITRELTIAIPVRIDSIERKENLDAVLSFLLEVTQATIIVLEADNKQHFIYSEPNPRVEYLFIEDCDPIYHIARYRNKLLRMSKTNTVGLWDADIIINRRQIINSVKAIKDGASLCYPYDGHFIFLDKEQSMQAKSDVISFLSNQNKEKSCLPHGRTSVGGAFIVNKERYLQLGGENENFYGWGFEDTERFKRMEILREPVTRISGVLFHLYHPRGVNSVYGNDERGKNNIKEFIRICRMTPKVLREYITNNLGISEI